MKQIKVLLADEKEIFREGLAKLLDEQEHIVVISQCSDGEQAIKKVKETEPDVVLMDSNISECDSRKATQQINESSSEVKVAMLTDSKSEEELFSAMEAGAIGYLSKDIEVDDLIKSIDLISKGEVVVSPPLAEKLADKLTSIRTDGAKNEDSLSKREIEIIKLSAKAATNKEIAERARKEAGEAKRAREEAERTEEARKAKKEAERAKKEAGEAKRAEKEAGKAEKRASKEARKLAKEKAKREAEEATKAGEEAERAEKEAGKAEKRASKEARKLAKEKAKREAEEATKIGEEAETYEEEVKLVLPSLVSFERLKQFEKHIEQDKNLKIVWTAGSKDKGAIIAVLLQKSLNLIAILNEMPMVQEVHRKGETIVVMLKAPIGNSEDY